MLKAFGRLGRQPDQRIGSEAEFKKQMAREKQRLARSGRPFVVVDVRATELLQHGPNAARQTLLNALGSALRETDWIGWSQPGSRVSLICAETGSFDGATAGGLITNRIRGILSAALPASTLKQVQVSFACYANEEISSAESEQTGAHDEVILAC